MRQRQTPPLPVSSNWLPSVQAFRNQFNNQDSDWLKVEKLKQDISAHRTQNPNAGLPRPLFDRIVTWKLEQQENRAQDYRQHVTDDFVEKITACAFSLDHPNRHILARVRLNVLSALPGVNMGVASGILALTFPNDYGVIDPRVWKHVYGAKKTGFTLPDYTMYLGDLLDGAARLQWPAQVLDFFTWKMP